MESLRTAVDNAPLLVNLLRLIRDARSPNFKDHEKGPVTFHFGGLSMRDSGSYEEAEELWRRACWSSGAMAPNAASPFRGPLHLAVYLNESPVEVWTVQDYREPRTDHSVPRDFEQLEALNTLVRVLFAHLRCQEIYGVVLQSCVTTTDETSSSVYGSLPQSPVPRDASWSSARTPHSPANHVSLRLFDAAQDCPTIPAAARRQFLWSSDDFVRVDVAVDRTWRHHSWMQPGTQAASPVGRGLDGNKDARATESVPVSGAGRSEQSSPIRACSPGSRRFGSDADGRSQSTSPEVMGSLGKSSLPTPHLAPSTSLAVSTNRPRSPGAPLSPRQAISELALPPAELSDLFERDPARLSLSSPGMPRTSVFASCHGGAGAAAAVGVGGAAAGGGGGGGGAGAAQAASAAGVGVNRLEDAVWLSNAQHVRLMGTLVYSRKLSPSVSVSPLSGRKTRHGVAMLRPKVHSLVPSMSMGAMSGVDIDRHLLSSDVDLEDLGAEAGSTESSTSVPGSAATEQLISLLGLCSRVKLQHVQPAPFGDLVLALNLREAS